MEYGYKEYSAIKKLLDKYMVSFRSFKDYENFITELVEILKI